MQAQLEGYSRPVDVVISLMGAGTSLLVVAANLIIARLTGFDLLSLTVWFVIPAGALGGGLAAASGYYLGAKWTQTMPSRRLLLNMVAIGGSAWFLGHWVDYFTTTFEDGTLLRDSATFLEFLDAEAQHRRLVIGGSLTSTTELGWLGYLREGLQLLGFLAGGGFAYIMLDALETCPKCRKYSRTRKLLTATSIHRLQEITRLSDIYFPSLAAETEAALRGAALRGIDITFEQCPTCEARWLHFAAVINGNDNERRRPLRTRYSCDKSQLTRLEEAIAATDYMRFTGE